MSQVFLYTPGGRGRRLALAIGASRLQTFDGMDFWNKRERVILPVDAIIINWARVQLDLDGPRLLNGGSYMTADSAHILRHLYNTGLRTLPIYFYKGPKPTGASHGLQRWIARRWDDSFHPLQQPVTGVYWTRWVELTREFRLHMFNGRCIKSGEKVPQSGLTVAKSEEAWAGLVAAAHPWWRSSKAGWTVDYDSFKSNDDMRKFAKRAVMALGLHFAAVDIGQDAAGNLYILKVDPTPVLSEHLTLVYSRNIKKWIDNPKAEGEEDTAILPPREAVYYPPPPGMPQPVRTGRVPPPHNFRNMDLDAAAAVRPGGAHIVRANEWIVRDHQLGAHMVVPVEEPLVNTLGDEADPLED